MIDDIFDKHLLWIRSFKILENILTLTLTLTPRLVFLKLLFSMNQDTKNFKLVYL